MDSSKLFTPLKVGNIQLAHRITLPPMTRFRVDEGHIPQDQVAEYYAQRAAVPGTLLITEATLISTRPGVYTHVPGLWSKEQIAQWRKVTDAVHAKGSFIYNQLWALGRVADPEATKKEHGGSEFPSMLSQIVTAAKGILFPEQNSYGNSTTATTEPNETLPATKSKMVTTRRSAAFQAVSPTEDAEMNGSPELSGKRKSDNSTLARSPETQGNKRRKRSSVETTEDMVKETNEDIGQEAAPKKHFRFDSEEPVLPDVAESEVPVDAQQKQLDEEDSSEDEAPETVDNSTQLNKIKLEAKKRDEARKIEEQAKREKRRQLDEARKQQAKASAKRKEVHTSQVMPGAGTPAEDMLSESSATLQGSFTQDTRRSTLPALLPDDILNAVPDVRPPTPPPEFEVFSQKKPTKLRFLEKKEKAPKDVRMGDVAIRVLDSESSRKQPNTALAPKASKASRGAREAWLKQARSTGHVNGMRMVSSGKRSFVRK